MKHRKTLKKALPAVTFATLFVGVALWQFYSFVAYKNMDGVVDLQGGEHHLWWAIGFGLIACVAAFLIFSIFLRYDKNDELHITSPPVPREMIP